jgi:hypothetical protein
VGGNIFRRIFFLKRKEGIRARRGFELLARTSIEKEGEKVESCDTFCRELFSHKTRASCIK